VGSRRGFVLITTVLALVVLLAFLGLAIDVGYVQFVKTRMQTAADAAAIGGAQEIRANGASGAAPAAKADAALNGFADGQNGVTVTVHSPPVSGYYTGDATAVEVVIAQDVPPFFLELVGASSMAVRARAVSHLTSGPSCVYALDPAANGALAASGGATLGVNCGIEVNSSSSQAMKASGGAQITATYTSVVGNYTTSGGGSISPAPITGAAAVGDPLAYIAAPAVGACLTPVGPLSITSNRTLDPGVYCGGISISAGSRVSFNPGVYVLRGGGLSVSGGSNISGTGVTFYNSAGSGYGYQGISFSGGSISTLHAPTSGPLAGILMFQDRSVTGGGASTISGGTGTIFDGALYFPGTALSYSGGTSSAYTLLVAKTLSFSGGTTVNNDYSSLVGGSPVKGGAALGE
jgi:hypothetical protein